MNSFKHSTAVVTGAASGIGRALTGALIERGAVVVKSRDVVYQVVV